MTLMLPVAGKLIPKLNIKLTMGVSMTVLAATYAISSQFTTLTHWYIAGAVLGACYAFIMYLPIPILINNWFDKKVGLALGIAVAFASIWAAFTNPFGSMFIAEYGWRTARIILGGAAWVMAMPFIIFVIRYKPADMGLKPYGYEEGISQANINGELAGVTASAAIRSVPFYCVFLIAGFFCFAASMLQQMPGYAVSIGLAPTIGGTAVSFIMMGGITGKFGLGYLNDKIDIVKATLLGCTSGVLGLLLILVAKTNVTFLFAGAFMFGIAYALLTIEPPLIVRRIFGSRNYSEIYSYVTFAMGAGGAIAPLLYGYIFDVTGSFYFAFLFCIAAYLLSCLLIVTAVRTGKKAGFMQKAITQS